MAGILIWVNSIPEPGLDDAENIKNPETSEEIELFKTETDNVKSVKITNENEAFTILKNGDVYTVLEKPEIEYSNTQLSFAFLEFTDMTALMDATDNEIPFSETARADVTLNDGSVHSFILGNAVIGESNHFLKYNDRIYVIPTYNTIYFTQPLNDYRDKHITTLNPTMQSLEIAEKGKKLVSLRTSTEDDNKKIDVLGSYVIIYPKYLNASMDRLNEFIKLLGEDGYSIDVEKFADDNINNTSKYNIGKKSLTISDNEKTTVIDFGDKDENGDVYAVINSGKSIYTIKSELYDIIDKYNADILMEKLTHIVNLDSVKTISFSDKNEKFVLERKGEKDNYSYEINQKKVSEDDFKEIYQEIIGINSDRIAYEKVSGTADYTVTVLFKDGKTDIWEYISLNNRDYLLTKNGEAQFISIKKNPQTAMANIKKILK